MNDQNLCEQVLCLFQNCNKHDEKNERDIAQNNTIKPI